MFSLRVTDVKYIDDVLYKCNEREHSKKAQATFVSIWLDNKDNCLTRICASLILFLLSLLHKGGTISYECQTSTVKDYRLDEKQCLQILLSPVVASLFIAEKCVNPIRGLIKREVPRSSFVKGGVPWSLPAWYE